MAQFPSIADNPEFVTGEASPGYFYLPNVDQRIRTLFLQTKLIVLLRNPVDRAISWYYHNANRGLESKSLETVIETEKAQLQQMSESDCKKTLSAFFRPHNEKLSAYLGQDYTW